jgi:hypothetical protein
MYRVSTSSFLYPINPIHKGSVQLRTGAIVGLPASFLYTSTEELAAVKMLIDPRVSKRIVDWTSNPGKLLLESLVLSDKAKAFVIARELMYVTAYDLHVDIGLRCLCGVLAYTTGTMLNSSMQVRRDATAETGLPRRRVLIQSAPRGC